MAQDDKAPTAAEKGKGKMEDTLSKKSDEPKKDKDGKPIAGGKDDAEPKGGRLFGQSVFKAVNRDESAFRPSADILFK